MLSLKESYKLYVGGYYDPSRWRDMINNSRVLFSPVSEALARNANIYHQENNTTDPDFTKTFTFMYGKSDDLTKDLEMFEKFRSRQQFLTLQISNKEINTFVAQNKNTEKAMSILNDYCVKYHNYGQFVNYDDFLDILNTDTDKNNLDKYWNVFNKICLNLADPYTGRIWKIRNLYTELLSLTNRELKEYSDKRYVDMVNKYDMKFTRLSMARIAMSRYVELTNKTGNDLVRVMDLMTRNLSSFARLYISPDSFLISEIDNI